MLIWVLHSMCTCSINSFHTFTCSSTIPLNECRIQIEASLLRVQTIPIGSSFWKECWAFSRGLSLSILLLLQRCMNDAEALHGEILVRFRCRLFVFRTSVEVGTDEITIFSAPSSCTSKRYYERLSTCLAGLVDYLYWAVSQTRRWYNGQYSH